MQKPQTARLTRQLAAIGLISLGGMTATSLWAQTSPPPKPEKIEVTGSAIKRIDAEGPAPVEIITKKDIERTGATSINELLKSLSTVDIFDQGELASNSPSGSGTANVLLRGLAETDTLVLLNGRRLPVNALYDSSGAGAAVDVNMIPLSAIERIEILKDGGSAIYGADAVAGVINFITKKSYEGIDLRAGLGRSSRSDGDEQNVGLSAGFGNYDKDRFNVLVAFDYFKRDPILRADREISRSSDFRRFGGNDGRSSFAPQGNFIDPNTGAFTGQSARPCPPELFSGGRCRYDFNTSILTSINGADRTSAMATASFKLSDTTRLFGEIIYAKTEDKFEAHPAPDIYPFNGGTGLIFGRFLQAGPRTTERESELTRIVGGAEGSVAGMDWLVTAGEGKSEVNNQDSNYLNATIFANLVNSGQIDPTSTSNPQALVDSAKVRPNRIGESKTRFIDGKVTGEVMQLAAGPLAYAVGASWWKEELTDTPDPLTQQGLVAGSIQQAPVAAARTAKAVFAEFAVPVTKNIEAQLAVRHDKYPNNSKTSPKIAFRFTPTKELLFRASYAESFRAPSLKQLFGGQEEGAVNITFNGVPDVPAFRVTGSNPNLKPETGEFINVGVVWDVTPNISVSTDLFNIKKKDNINTPDVDYIVANRPDLVTVGADSRIRVQQLLTNIADTEISGVDVDLRVRIPGTAIGNISMRNAATYYDKIKKRNTPQDPLLNYAGTYGQARWRNTFAITAEKGPWAATATVRTVSGFADEDDPSVIGAATRRVETHDEIDVVASYTGIKKMKIDVGIKNLLDMMPPYSLQNTSSNDYTQAGFAELYNNRGRFWFATLSYQFK
ncbi:MAG: TonB-dependent receptor [Burkholderiales bacterium]|nr:TonB-dependent receptor [Burkholderiales bacterium]